MMNPNAGSSNRFCPPLGRRDLLAILLLAALVLLFFWRIVTLRLEDRVAFPPGDFTDQFWAFRMVAARAFAQGRMPLWSEFYNSGHPFLADVQSAIYYPIGLIFTLGAVARSGSDFALLDLELEALLHFMLAAAFTYLLARRLAGSRVAALVSAITFALGGYLTAYPPQQLAILETATWLPLALLLLDLATAKGPGASRWRYYMAAGLVLGVAVLAGHPQTAMFAFYACALYFVWRVLSAPRDPLAAPASRLPVQARRLGLAPLLGAAPGFILTLVVAAGISAAQWVPSLEYQTVSTRTDLTWADAARGFPTIDPLQMILPGFTAAFQSPLYVGILPLWLAALALSVNRSRDKVFWALLALGALLVSFGAYVFAYALLYLAAPGFGIFRDQERLALIVSLALALLAGFGMRELLQDPETAGESKRLKRVWALLPAGLTLSVMMLFVFYSAATVRASSRLAFLLDRSGLMVLIFALAGVLTLARITRRVPANVFAVLALALVVFDLFSIDNAAYNAELKPRYPVTPVIAAIQADPGLYRVADEGKQPGHFGIAYRLQEIGGISPLRTAHYDALLELAPEKLWPLLGVRYVITERPGFAGAEVVLAEGETRLLRLADSLPRAWLAGQARPAAGDAATLAAMQDAAFDPRAVAYVAGPLPFAISAGGDQPDVTIKTYAPERIVMTVNAPRDSLLVTSEVYYPGWRATVDGVDTPILRADVALRALALRAGAHTIEMTYDPWSVKIGLGLTIATLAALVAGWLLIRRSAIAA